MGNRFIASRDEVKELRDEVTRLEELLDGRNDEIDELKEEIESLEKEAYDFEVTTPLGTISINCSGNFKHIEMIEEFLAYVKSEA